MTEKQESLNDIRSESSEETQENLNNNTIISPMIVLGISVGASRVGFVELNSDNKIKEVAIIEHNGNPRKVLKNFLAKKKYDSIMVTGRKFRHLLNLSLVSEPEAIEEALTHCSFRDYDTLVSIGGENFMVYTLNHGKIRTVYTGNKCAAGTGEFFLQQTRRMGLTAEQAVNIASKKPYKISGRCSVFCKSDCTHALNKGTNKGEVVAGLCKMMAQKVGELLSKVQYKNVLVIGGCTKNKSMMHFLKKKVPQLLIPKQAEYFEALGTAILATKKNTKELTSKMFVHDKTNFTFHKPLPEFKSLVTFKQLKRGTVKDDDITIIGLDVGSTTTKAVLLRLSDNKILASEYLRTDGDPIKASINCYKSLNNQINVPIKIIGLGVTGSGRQIAGLHALTKGVINEIIAHATAAAFFDSDVDTIFEIGGQDAKYTYLTNGVPSDYAMNEACSAGTGSFLEEAAKESLNMDYKEIGKISLTATKPPNFNDQCAAFISSDIKNAIHEEFLEKILLQVLFTVSV